MKPSELKKLAEAYLSVVDETNANDVSDDGEGLDDVQPDALKKKFKNRKDKDIDNDGDVDSSDKYLHKRRKAVSKAIKRDKDKNKVAGNPHTTDKKSEISKIADSTKLKEFASFLTDIMEKKKKRKETEGAAEPEGLTDKESPKSKEFIAKHKVKTRQNDSISPENKKAEDAGIKPKAGKRPQDSTVGEAAVNEKNIMITPRMEGKAEIYNVPSKKKSGKDAHEPFQYMRVEPDVHGDKIVFKVRFDDGSFKIFNLKQFSKIVKEDAGHDGEDVSEG